MSTVVVAAFGERRELKTRFDLDAAIAASKSREPEPDAAEFERRFPGDQSMGDEHYFCENQFLVEMAAERAEDMCRYFYAVLHFVPDIDRVTLWRELMQRMGMSDICDELRAGTREQWRYKPNYYSALVTEFYDRVGRVLQLLDL